MLFYNFLFTVSTAYLCKGANLEKSCSEGGTVLFDLVEILPLINQPRFTVERIFRSSDDNCRGTISFAQPEIEQSINDNLRKLGSDVFQNLALVTEIDLRFNLFENSNANMYTGTPIETINARGNQFGDLDSGITFPRTLRKLIFSSQAHLSKVDGIFFENHPNLTELDISKPQTFTGFSFSRFAFDNAISLRRLIATSLPVTVLPKELFSTLPNLSYLNIDNWKKLTLVENNAFGSLRLDELDLGRWPFKNLEKGLFSGASIKRLNFQGAQLLALGPSTFVNLRDLEQLDFSASKLTSIDAEAFDSFIPAENLSLILPSSPISCCQIELSDLISKADGLTINGNGQNYTCLTPDDTDKIVNMTPNQNPADGLVCCDFELEFYNNQTKMCQDCMTGEFCLSSSDRCDGENSENLFCNQCDRGFNNIDFPYKCEACVNSLECDEPSNECMLDSKSLKCSKCIDGYSVDTFSGSCIACIQASAECTNYSTSCIAETNNLQCLVCGSGTTVDTFGSCVKYSLSVLVIAIVAGVVVFSVILVIVITFYLLYRRNQAKQKALRIMYGLDSNDTLTIQTDEEFRAAVANGDATDEEFSGMAPPLFNYFSSNGDVYHEVSDFVFSKGDVSCDTIEDLVSDSNVIELNDDEYDQPFQRPPLATPRQDSMPQNGSEINPAAFSGEKSDFEEYAEFQEIELTNSEQGQDDIFQLNVVPAMDTVSEENPDTPAFDISCLKSESDDFYCQYSGQTDDEYSIPVSVYKSKLKEDEEYCVPLGSVPRENTVSGEAHFLAKKAENGDISYDIQNSLDLTASTESEYCEPSKSFLNASDDYSIPCIYKPANSVPASPIPNKDIPSNDSEYSEPSKPHLDERDDYSTTIKDFISINDSEYCEPSKSFSNKIDEYAMPDSSFRNSQLSQKYVVSSPDRFTNSHEIPLSQDEYSCPQPPEQNIANSSRSYRTASSRQNLPAKANSHSHESLQPFQEEYSCPQILAQETNNQPSTRCSQQSGFLKVSLPTNNRSSLPNQNNLQPSQE